MTVLGSHRADGQRNAQKAGDPAFLFYMFLFSLLSAFRANSRCFSHCEGTGLVSSGGAEFVLPTYARITLPLGCPLSSILFFRFHQHIFITRRYSCRGMTVLNSNVLDFHDLNIVYPDYYRNIFREWHTIIAVIEIIDDVFKFNLSRLNLDGVSFKAAGNQPVVEQTGDPDFFVLLWADVEKLGVQDGGK
jgi:hypothetical protein